MRNWSLQAKIIGVVSIFVTSNLLVLGIGLSKLSNANRTSEEIVYTLAKRVELVNELKYNQTMIAVATRDALLNKEAEQRKAFTDKMAAGKALQEKKIDEFSKIASEQGRTMIGEYRTHFTAWYGSWAEVYSLDDAGKSTEALDMVKKYVGPQRQSMADSLDQIIKLNEDRMTEATREAGNEYTISVVELSSICAIALLIGGIFAFVTLRRLNKAISGVIQNLQSNSNQVAAASAQIASSSEELSQASTEQAASLEETAASLEQISAMIAKSSENASTTAIKSAESQAKAEEGSHAVEQMMNSMNEISQSNETIMTQINASNQQMTEIVRVIQEIGNKTKVINEIVFQTKLLSFNASVEAARAGDHGKGFAVVAEEVGNLAQMSGNAAMEISEMLTGSINKVEQIVSETKNKVQTLTEQGKKKVQDGVNVARQCSHVLKDIVQNVAQVSALAQEISQGSKEQAQGVGEINKAMGQLDSVTQQNASTSEEAASAAEQLSAQSQALLDTVQDLTHTVMGGKRTDPTTLTQTAPSVSPTKTAQVTNLANFKSNKLSQSPQPSKVKLKVAVGDGRMPNRDDDGFTDI